MNALSAHTGVLRPTAPAVAAPRFSGWGLGELFVIAQTALPALLFFPGTQPIRLYLRVASFILSAAILFVWATSPKIRRPAHPAEPWLVAATIYVALMMLHPLTNSVMAGAAHLALYVSVIAPLFWAGACVRGPDQLARVLGILLVCNGVNSMVGVLQVYDPATWMPQEMSRIVTESAFGLGAVTYMGPNGLIVRPPGLFDNPGAVAGPGMYAALLGLVFAIGVAPWWKRVASLIAAFAGMAAIYLSQVRVSLVVCVVMLVSYVAVLAVQRRTRRATIFGSLAAGLVVGDLLVLSAARGRQHCRADINAADAGSDHALFSVARWPVDLHVRRAAHDLSGRRRSRSLGDDQRLLRRKQQSRVHTSLGGDSDRRLGDRRWYPAPAAQHRRPGRDL